MPRVGALTRTVYVVILLAVGLSLTVRTRAQSPQAGEQPKGKSAADAGRALRMMMLRMSPVKAGIKPTEEFPRVYGILMDWPIDGDIATVLSTSTGAASLYTTSTFGILGGETHEGVRAAARRFVRAADDYHDVAMPTTDYPYPAADRVRFYLLTFEGVRVIETDLPSISKGSSRYTRLFGLGQAVLSELRRITENRR